LKGLRYEATEGKDVGTGMGGLRRRRCDAGARAGHRLSLPRQPGALYRSTGRQGSQRQRVPHHRRPRPAVAAASAARGEGSRVSASDQRARDSDARRILETELRREEERLAALKKDYNNGEPERQGDERNYQKYLDRVAEMKASILRKESDIASIKREIDKLSQ